MFINELKDGCYKCDWNASDRSINPMPICLCGKECINSNQYEFYIKGESMTKLEQLKQDIENSTWELKFKDEDEFYKMLSDKYSITLRNNDSSADNNKVEQLHSDEVSMRLIGDMVVSFSSYISNKNYSKEKIRNLDSYREFEKNLAVMLKYHRNIVSTAVNQKDDSLVSEDELVSKIETILFNLSTTMIDDYYGNEVIAISGKNKIAKEIAKLFKTYQNSVLRQDLNKVSKYSNRGETESKIAFKNSLRHNVGKLVTADQELDQIVENIVNFFINTVNPVFRALNDADEQSIIK